MSFRWYFRINRQSLKKLLLILALVSVWASCETIDLFEKNASVPGNAWDYGFKPEFRFEIKDTTVSYQVYFVLRHTDAYGYNNIWIKADMKGPLDSVWTSQRFDCPLATNDRWMGSAMDDLYEHRILLSPRPVRFPRAGSYQFKLEQVMRDNPLQHVMNVGLRVEKIRS